MTALRAHLRAQFTAHALSEAGISKATRKQHLSLLQDLATQLPEDLHDTSIPRALLEWLERKRHSKKLTFTTVDQQMGNMAGALKRLPQYCQDELMPVLLSEDQQWKDAGKAVRHFSNRESAQARPGCSQEEMLATITAQHHDPQMQSFLMLMWATAGRPGDVLKLKTKHVSLHESERGLTIISALFDQGKVLKTADPYTIHTAIPDEWAAILQAHKDARQQDGYLFPIPSYRERAAYIRKAREVIRSTNAGLDLRSVRRGSARTLARAGVPLSVVMLFTRHANVTMLRRYLGFGQVRSEEASKATAAASALWPRRC